MRPVERQMVEALLAYPGHVICTLRVKTDWVEGENARGKRQMMKVGTKAEQREGLEYEFDLVASMDLNNELTVGKSRCPALSGEIVDRPGVAYDAAFTSGTTTRSFYYGGAGYKFVSGVATTPGNVGSC